MPLPVAQNLREGAGNQLGLDGRRVQRSVLRPQSRAAKPGGRILLAASAVRSSVAAFRGGSEDESRCRPWSGRLQEAADQGARAAARLDFGGRLAAVLAALPARRHP